MTSCQYRSPKAGVLKGGLQKPRASGDDLAAPFGYRAPFTARYRSWLHKTGIIEQGSRFRLTPMGETIWKYDPEFKHMVTQWYMHHELCNDPTRNETWHFFVNEFLPKNSMFTRDKLEAGLAKKLMPHGEKHFRAGSRMTKTISLKLLECYTTPEALGSLGILSSDGKGNYRYKKPKPLGPWEAPQQLEREFAK